MHVCTTQHIHLQTTNTHSPTTITHHMYVHHHTNTICTTVVPLYSHPTHPTPCHMKDSNIYRSTENWWWWGGGGGACLLAWIHSSGAGFFCVLFCFQMAYVVTVAITTTNPNCESVSSTGSLRRKYDPTTAPTSLMG
eukprot:m.25931 g.25931  ORF g.25931 m.25931 type:complete len:137 (-) comp15222_c0_seq1:1080-1490(-)